jgi:hypothetical protein
VRPALAPHFNPALIDPVEDAKLVAVYSSEIQWQPFLALTLRANEITIGFIQSFIGAQGALLETDFAFALHKNFVPFISLFP